MAQLEHIEAIEKRLWKAADTLRANSKYASNEYFIPIMGLIFLRHAYSRFLAVKDELEANLPRRGGTTRALTKEDFSKVSAIYLRPEAHFDYLVALKDSDDRIKAIIKAMESIEADYTHLRGDLPKSEYQELDNETLGQLLRTLNPEELRRASGDVFGRIYEYFLTQFADLKAHDNGEFFTPVSLVSLIANVLEPTEGTVLDPACGSGGMFVQSAHFVERIKENPTDKLTFRGLEKNRITIRLAKMNLAVHGLEGDIKQAITYYQDPHELLKKADFVMANPPFNVDEVDANKVKNDPRLPFGLPGVNKSGKVSNGNYLWISYFYSYLNEIGRSGFVMSSQASSAGRDEAKVRQKLIETGDVDIMIAIRSNFFYTRAVPCELWFLNRAKPEEYKNKVLMIDLRNIYRKVTRKIYDFSSEQEKNILAIVWLYRGQSEQFLTLLVEYIQQILGEAWACFEQGAQNDTKINLFDEYEKAMLNLQKLIQPFLSTAKLTGAQQEQVQQFSNELKTYTEDWKKMRETVTYETSLWGKQEYSIIALSDTIQRLSSLSEKSRDMLKDVDLIFKLASRLIDTCEQELNAKENELWVIREIVKARKTSDEVRQFLVNQLKQIRYFHRHTQWLMDRFPQAELRDVEGLVKLVDIQELRANDWSLTPGRYVGVAPEEEDDDFDFEESLRDIHIELEDLNAEAIQLALKIKQNFEEMGV